MTIPDTDITWVKQSLNSIVNQYVRSWLEIRITSALDITQLSKTKFHICYVMLSSRFTQCQTVICNNLRKSWNNEVLRIYYDTNCDTTFYNSINSNLLKKLLLKIIKKNKEDWITNVLTTQTLGIKSIWKHGMKSVAEIWSKSVSKLPNNSYNFSIRYVNNSLANATNMHKCDKTASPWCLHCNKNQTLGHVVETSLREKRYNYCNDSILLNLSRITESIKSKHIYIDIPGFDIPGQRPYLIVISNRTNWINLLESTAAYETNIDLNSERKEKNYRALMDSLAQLHYSLQFVNFSMATRGSIVKHLPI